MILIILAAASLSLPPVPGSINPAVTQDNIKTTICVPGFTGTIRPKSSYTTKLKIQQMKTFKLPGKTSDYEEDHLISLEIGGNPTDPNNLWPQPWHGNMNAHDKDRLENRLHKLVCSGQMTLKEAQKEISTNWIDSFKHNVKTAKH